MSVVAVGRSHEKQLRKVLLVSVAMIATNTSRTFEAKRRETCATYEDITLPLPVFDSASASTFDEGIVTCRHRC